MKNLTPQLRSHILQEVTTLAQCLLITRQDGRIYAFTSHDQPLTISNLEYTPIVGFTRSSLSASINLDVDTFDIDSVLNSEYVNRADIVSGLLDHAEVRLMVVNWAAPDEGFLIHRRGWTGTVEMNEDLYSVEVQGLTQVLRHKLGAAYSPECRADLGDRRCNINIDPSRWQANTQYGVGDTVLGVVDPALNFVNVVLNNPSFEADNLNVFVGAPEGWEASGSNNIQFKITNSDGNLTPKHGTQFVAHIDTGSVQTKTAILTQTLDLVGLGAPATALDTGLCRLMLRTWAASLTSESWHTVRVIALDEFNRTVGVIYSPAGRNTPNDRWVEYYARDVLIPAGARQLQINLISEKSSDKGQGTAFDEVQGAINLPDGTFGSADQFGGVMMRCIRAGTSGATEPAFSNLIDSEIIDNTVTWRVVDNFKDVGVVDTITSAKTFQPIALPNPAGWYDFGLLYWETGANAGRAQEVKRWIGGSIELFQRPFFEVAAGDRFVIHAGCDKRRVTCAEKFSNIFNFRGEPDVPGRDEYYRTPNSPEE